jgi:hypothetical protein
MSALAARKPASTLRMSGRAVSRLAGGVRLTGGMVIDASSNVGTGKFCGAWPSKIARALAVVVRGSTSDAKAVRKPLTATRCWETSRPETLPSGSRPPESSDGR